MFSPLLQMFRPKAEPRPLPSVPPGTRWYAVGDVHGRLDLFDAIREAIEADDSASPPAATTVVLLGDLVDRGPDSAGVVARARDWQTRRSVRLLSGNHEEMFLDSLEDIGVMRHFLRHGGRETALSYGIPRAEYDQASLEELQAMLNRAVPAADIAFLNAASNYLIAGDYLFVHAGIAPDVPLEEQKPHHLRWIREPFLEHDAPHTHFVIHGHTITEDVDERANRTGIDTGAYRTGVLTALVLEGTARRLIQAVERNGAVTIEREAYAA
ncbi:serine/threonine protein phosphatase [Altererythrobacter aerius]|uniref:Serine/threonine protein phosphatase n=2 Tax=Tsuneonella aeria TaxID=1837929 RepID=A0A6I4TD07_9SPHN|nr:metallophosphoesterase family protein [Tsuneonella aeria]MXO74664.1 serine/threonine protein phosphatase [Tsuneonella aeria]